MNYFGLTESNIRLAVKSLFYKGRSTSVLMKTAFLVPSLYFSQHVRIQKRKLNRSSLRQLNDDPHFLC